MSPQAKRAHLRMLEILPRRTHEWQPITREWGGGPSAARSAQEKEAMRADMTAMRANGANNRELCEEFHCTNNTILKMIGPTARGRSRLAR